MENYFQLGSQAIKGGILFGNLTPAGIFSNKPYQENLDLFLEQLNNNSSSSNNINEDCDKKYLLTLGKLKESLQKELDKDLEISDKLFKSFLTNSIQLLIDYDDARNYIFYGSSYSELAYNILFLIDNYHYKAYLAKKNSNITLNYLTNNRTEILIKKSEIVLGGDVFNLQEKDNLDFTKFVIEDKELNEYKILDYETPLYQEISSIAFNTSDTIIDTILPHNLITGDRVKIKLSNNKKLNNIFYVEEISPTQIKIFSDKIRLNNVIVPNANLYDNEARLRKYVELYTYTGDYDIRFVVQGNIPIANLLQYTEGADIFYGLQLKRNKQYYFDFENKLTDLQKRLLNKTIAKPWPRQPITNNILFQGALFEEWITDAGNFQSSFNYEDDGFGSYNNELALELSITGALYLDEEWTNQLLRKTVPHYLIDELRDSEGLFKRFILMMAWFWDQIRLYINFLTYNHHLNYTQYNQLTYKFYDLYSKHFGFNLFEEDNIELSRLLLRTEPGLIYQNNLAEFSDDENRKTLYILQKEKQKRLLINLLFLYKKKGTLDGLNKLINLLGVPKGLVITNEYYLDFVNKDEYGVPLDNNKQKKINNDKVFSKKILWTKNYDSLKNKSNIDTIENNPFFYDIKSREEFNINLRELDLLTSPQDALLSDIEYLSNKKYDFVEMQPGSFFNLQNLKETYYMLPLSIPDKYIHFSVNFLLEKESALKNNRVDLCSLFLSTAISPGTTPILPKGNQYNYFIERFGYYNMASFDLVTSTQNDIIEIVCGSDSIFNDILPSDFLESNAKYISNKINIENKDYKSTAEGNRIFIFSKKLSLNSITLLVNFNPGNIDTSILNIEDFTNTLSILQNDFIICRIENSKLVFRMKMHGDFSSSFFDTVSISKHMVLDDGLLHNYKFLFRPSGIEIYRDLKFVELIPYRDALSANSAASIPQYDSRITPLNEIEDCTIIESLNSLYKRPDNINEIKYWDLFIGDPRNIKIWFNKVGIFEDREINQESDLEYNQSNNDNFNSEGYLFKPNIINKNFDAYFSSKYPLINGENLIHYLPFDNNNKISKLNLIPYQNIEKEILFEKKIQSFFENTQDKNKFPNYAWVKDLHLREEYSILKNIIDNYFEFNTNVIYYENLLPIIDLIERKFKLTAQQFIPVVINTNKFAQLIQSEVPDKYRYINPFKKCDINNLGKRASLKILMFWDRDTPIQGTDFIKLDFEDLGIFTQPWNQSSFHTLYLIGEQIKNISPSNISYIINNNNKIIFFIEQNWYFTTYGKKIEDTSIVASGNGPENIILASEGWEAGIDKVVGGNCFEIEYQTPLSNQLNNNFYIYYQNERVINSEYNLDENMPNDIYYDSELGFNRFTNDIN